MPSAAAGAGHHQMPGGINLKPTFIPQLTQHAGHCHPCGAESAGDQESKQLQPGQEGKNASAATKSGNSTKASAKKEKAEEPEATSVKAKAEPAVCNYTKGCEVSEYDIPDNATPKKVVI